MPQTIGALILAAVDAAFATSTASATVTVLGTTYSVAQIVGTTVLVATSVAISASQIPKGLDSQTQQQNIKQPIPARRRYYGRVKIGGSYVLGESKDGFSYDVIALCDGPIDAIEEHWLIDRSVSLHADGYVTTFPYVVDALPRVYVLPKLGETSQTAHAKLIADLSSLWTSDHRGKGIANVLVVANSVFPDQFITVYPSGAPAYRAVIRAAKVYDPRNDTTAWSDNPVLALRDYLTHADGYRLPSSFVNNSTWTTAANVCDDLIALKAGGTEKRYRLGMGYAFDEARRDTLRRILPTFDGALTLRGDGTVGVTAGKWVEPTVTIPDAHILSYEISRGSGKLRTANTIRAKYTSAAHDYQSVEAEPWVDAADVAARGELEQSLELTTISSFAQCRRLMKLQAARANPNWVLTLVTTIKGFEALGERFIRVQIAELGLDETFEVNRVDMDIASMKATLDLSSLASSAYAWDAASEEGTPPAVPPPSEESTLPVPANLTAGVVLLDLGGGNSAPALAISCDTPTQDALVFVAEWTPDGTTDWLQVQAPFGSFSAQTPPLAVGFYDVRARFLRAGQSMGYTGILQDVSVTNTPSAPSAPTALSAVNASGTVTLKATAPNHPNHRALRFWRHSSNTFASATDITGAIFGSPSVEITRTDTPGSGTWHYWSTSEFSAAVRSSPAGSVNVVV